MSGPLRLHRAADGTPISVRVQHTGASQRQLAKERYDAELAERQRREADPFEQACTLLRRRGVAVFAAAVLEGGKPDRWRVGSRVLTRDEVLAMAARQRDPAVKNAPAPIKIRGDAPMAIASSVKPESNEPPPAEERFRGVGADVVLDWLKALRARFVLASDFADALGVPKGSLHPVLGGHQRPTAGMVAALFGATGCEIQPKWMELLAGGPVDVPRPEGECEQQDSADAGVAGSEATAPAVVDAALLSASADGGAGDVPPPAPAPAADESDQVQPGPGGGDSSVATPEPAEQPVLGSGPAIGGPQIPSAAATAIAQGRAGDGAFSPWSKLEDRDLVAILRGKLAGVLADAASLEAEDAALIARRKAIYLNQLDLEVRERALRDAISAFEPEQSDNEEGQAAPGIGGSPRLRSHDNEEGTTDGHEGAAEAA